MNTPKEPALHPTGYRMCGYCGQEGLAFGTNAASAPNAWFKHPPLGEVG
ncbi:hypothetical protein [Novipirellula herctigrandis]